MASKNLKTIFLIDFVLIILTLILSRESLVLFLVYLIASLFILRRNQNDWRVYLPALIFGFFVEITMVHFKVWVYPVSDILGVPAWIFLMWGILAVTAYQAGSYLHSKKL
jgi:hypothetical protein